MPNRIKELRKRAGLTVEQLGEMAKTSGQQVSRLEKGERRLTDAWMERLAHALGVEPWEIMPGSGRSAADSSMDSETEKLIAKASETAQEMSTYHVLEYDVGAAAGSGREPPTLNGDNSTPVLAEWSMPADMIRAHTTPAARLAVVRVEGDSMEPDYLSGDRVLVDLSRQMPTPPGVFVVWDGLGLVLKRLELVIGVSPRRVRLSSVNPAYLPYEVPHEELHISGRVIGKWMWR